MSHGYPQDQIEELKRLAPGVAFSREKEVPYFLLPGLALPDGCTPPATDALLCPVLRDGYHSRLFFAQQVTPAKAIKWTVSGVQILERQWHAFSWQLYRTDMRLAQMVLEHLRALRS